MPASQYVDTMKWIGGGALVILAVIVGLPAALGLLARRGVSPSMWWVLRTQRPIAATLLVLSFAEAVLGFAFLRVQATQRTHDFALGQVTTVTNLLGGPSFLMDPSQKQPTGWQVLTGTVSALAVDTMASGTSEADGVVLGSHTTLASNAIDVQPGALYRFTAEFSDPGALYFGDDNTVGPTDAQVRFLWLDRTLNPDKPVTWNDSPLLHQERNATSNSAASYDGAYAAPPDATHLRIELMNTGSASMHVVKAVLWEDGVHVESSPNGALGSLAFSFDWETAMGGPVHSKGMDVHDPAGAAQHGLLMRQGADWLLNLFATNHISATFYSTGYNFLDGNTSKQQFEGNPIFKWANPKDGWSNYWQTHGWFSDDPYGTVGSDPAWYFGDQARRLVAAGHEIGDHTFAHIYVRGSNPVEMQTDYNTWIAAAKGAGVPPPTTFAFPWRSSNSVKSDIYSLLYSEGIRAVTRIYAPDIKDQYAVGGVIGYPGMAVMPDFLLGAPSSAANEEAGGAEIGLDAGLHVINETLARRGTTSFWNHPEQLGDAPELASIRQTWQAVVQAAAADRDKGKLYIGTVADITAYQSAVMSVTTQLDNGFLGLGGWKLTVHNGSGQTLQGVTLTLPGDIQSASSGDATLLTVQQAQDGSIKLSAPGKLAFPARQIVLDNLKPGATTISLQWAPGMEPPR